MSAAAPARSGGRTCPSCGGAYGPDVLYCPVDGIPLSITRSLLGSSSELDPYLGLELPGQIELRALVGVGAMGRVYRAFQAGVDRFVAVKILHRELSGNPELVARFHREGKIASRLVHPNVVQVLLTGALPNTDDGRARGELYLVMEYLDGISLLSALSASSSVEAGAMPLPRALHIALQLCGAVGAAHERGIIHRDLKPENIMLVERADDPDSVKVLDFGIARLDELHEAHATQAGLIFGTAKYISPEGAEGKQVGPTADVYAIATILYECLAGVTPFDGDSPMAILVKQIHAAVPELRGLERASYVPEEIAAVIMKNLAKDPSQRARDAGELGHELLRAAEAAGLDVDALTSARGDLRLASKQRTRQQSFAKLAHGAGLTEIPTDGDDTLVGSSPVPLEAPVAGSARPKPTGAAEPLAGELDAASSPALAAQVSIQPSIGAPRASRTELSAPAERDSAPPPSSLVPPLPASVIRRADASRRLGSIWIAALALVLVPAAAVGSVYVLRQPSELEPQGELEEALEAAQSSMRRRAWDAPQGDNLREHTDRALRLAPGESRVLALRREGSERILADALERKYVGEHAEALRLARLAAELSPELVAATHLVSDLESRLRESAGASASPGPTEAVTAPEPRSPTPTRVDARVAVRSGAAAPASAGVAASARPPSSGSSAPPSARPSSSVALAPSASEKPPSPPPAPAPTADKPIASPAPTRPWL